MQIITKTDLTPYIAERFLTDPKYRQGHVNIISGAPGTEILGLHTPDMKRIAKDIASGNSFQAQFDAFRSHAPLTGEGGLTHEERMIWGLAIDYIAPKAIKIKNRLSLIEDFIPAIDNWAICDTFCCNAKWIDRALKSEDSANEIWQYVSGLIDSSDEFRSRVGLIISLAHFLGPDCIKRTLDTVVERNYSDSDPYYIRMGAAWLFAEALVKQYDIALPYILNHRLSPWIHNKSIQKARESFRISPDAKSYLNSLKR